MTSYDIDELKHQLENVEDNDAEAHKIYNNLGIAYASKCQYREALRAHRNEKRACKRLLDRNPRNPSCRVDLAIAYRLCGDVMLHVDRLVEANQAIVDTRIEVLKSSHRQHLQGLKIAREVALNEQNSIHLNAAKVEIQAASAAAGQSGLGVALESRQRSDWLNASSICSEAAFLAHALPEHGPNRISTKKKKSMMLGASVNFAITMSGLGERKKAQKLLVAIALQAREINDQLNYIRALSNLGEEAGIDEDWSLCVKYIRKWSQIARERGDEADEADALRKLSVALRELQQYDEAKEMLERALLLGATKDSRTEARNFLAVVEQDIEDRKKAEDELREYEQKSVDMQKDGDFVGESRARIEAGNRAFLLDQYENVIRILQRYFELVDDFECNPEVTGISEQLHKTAVANMGEAMWKLERYEEAVKWAARELIAFDGDIAGQAQACCNMGVYLDDYGKKDRAEEYLLKSISFAKQCGDEGIQKRAQSNLELIHEEKKAENEKQEMPDDDPDKIDHLADHRVSRQHSTTREKQSNHNTDHINTENINRVVTTEDNRQDEISPVENRDQPAFEMEPIAPPAFAEDVSMVDISNQPHGRRPVPISNELTAGRLGTGSGRGVSYGSTGDGTKSAISGGKIGVRAGSLSHSNPSGVGSAADRNSNGFRRTADLAAEYKSICSKRQHPTVAVRPMIVNAMRSLSSSLLAKEACDVTRGTPLLLNLSGLFLSNEDLSVILQTLSLIGEEETVSVDISLNPLLASTSYEYLNRRSYSSPSALLGIKHLNLSATGLTAKSLGTLSEALGPHGSLQRVTTLNISKNRLGLKPDQIAHAVAKILVTTRELEALDLSLNLLPNSFLGKLVPAIEQLKQQGGGLDSSALRQLYFYLNNRPHPTALLQVENTNEMRSVFLKLFQVLPSLEVVDVRACGASGQMRKTLRELAASLQFSQSILTVSDNVLDNFS